MIISRVFMNPEAIADRNLLHVDPITLTGLAIGALAGGGAALATSGGGSAPPAPAPTASAPPPSAPIGQPNKPAQNQPSFIGAAATPSTQSGQKTLLGQ